MKILFVFFFQLCFTFCFCQAKDSFLVIHSDWQSGMKSQNFYFLNPCGDTVLTLDSRKYTSCFTDTLRHFAIVSFQDKTGWWAIDRSENVLFEVLNGFISEPGPDELQEGLIRIIDNQRKIGFANERGQIVIKPRFDWVSQFRNNKAIFGKQCRIEPMFMNGKLSDEHLDIKCQEYGFINREGKENSNRYKTFEELAKLIKWY
jgi:hypothetical protein